MLLVYKPFAHPSNFLQDVMGLVWMTRYSLAHSAWLVAFFGGKVADVDGNWLNCFVWGLLRQLGYNLKLYRAIWGQIGIIWGRYGSRMSYYDSLGFSGDYIVLYGRQFGSVGLNRDQWRSIGGHRALWEPSGS